MKTVKTVGVAQRMTEFIDVFVQWIRDAGYDVRVCSGPDADNKCWANRRGGCAVWRQADMMVYDPWIASSCSGTGAFRLERQRHPDTPVLLWGSGAIPKDVAEMEQPELVEFLPSNISPQTLTCAIERMIGPPKRETAREIPWNASSYSDRHPAHSR
ncbi:MAG: hypothetical protein KGJ86_01655 [Chloroflexota bacterium]|nr:hypothetical protein [Chloroflexota bacterium]